MYRIKNRKEGVLLFRWFTQISYSESVHVHVGAGQYNLEHCEKRSEAAYNPNGPIDLDYFSCFNSLLCGNLSIR